MNHYDLWFLPTCQMHWKVRQKFSIKAIVTFAMLCNCIGNNSSRQLGDEMLNHWVILKRALFVHHKRQSYSMHAHAFTNALMFCSTIVATIMKCFIRNQSWRHTQLITSCCCMTVVLICTHVLDHRLQIAATFLFWLFLRSSKASSTFPVGTESFVGVWFSFVFPRNSCTVHTNHIVKLQWLLKCCVSFCVTVTHSPPTATINFQRWPPNALHPIQMEAMTFLHPWSKWTLRSMSDWHIVEKPALMSRNWVMHRRTLCLKPLKRSMKVHPEVPIFERCCFISSFDGIGLSKSRLTLWNWETKSLCVLARFATLEKQRKRRKSTCQIPGISPQKNPHRTAHQACGDVVISFWFRILHMHEVKSEAKRRVHRASPTLTELSFGLWQSTTRQSLGCASRCFPVFGSNPSKCSQILSLLLVVQDTTAAIHCCKSQAVCTLDCRLNQCRKCWILELPSCVIAGGGS